MGKSSEFSEIGSELRPLKFAQILTARMALFFCVLMETLKACQSEPRNLNIFARA